MLKKSIQRSAVIADGNHTLVFRKWLPDKSKAGNPMLVLFFTPSSGEPVIKDWIVFGTVHGWAKLEAFLATLGFAPSEQFDEHLLTDFLGFEIDVVITHEPFNGVMAPKIASYGHAVGDAAVGASATTAKIPLAPILSKEEQEERRRAIQATLEEQAASEHRAGMQETLDEVNQDNGETHPLGRLQQAARR
jgi:hypothetical protein